MRDNSYHEYVMSDLLGDVSGVTSRAMFGGWGIYRNGVIFGIIVAGELYFKVDDSNRARYEQAESRQFVYAKSDGKPLTMPYWLVPAEVMEDKEKLYDYMEESIVVSGRKKP